ncbi:MAG: aminotransferase class III-fold pyridoxal phosphate-dependent enzyme [Acidimicrobiales bacterium]
MSASEILDAAANVLVPTYAPLPIVPAVAAGSTVTDTEGNSYIDLGAGIAVTALGHNPPVLHAALMAQADRLWHVSNIFANEPAIRLAERLVSVSFADRVFFSNSGAEANEAALKLARRHAYNKGLTDKYEIIALDGAFHGRTLFTVSVGGTAAYKEGFGPPLEGIVHITPNSVDELLAAISERTCAVIVEPIQGEGGVRPLDIEFLQAARAACDANDALLIFDEIQTGAGRTGTLYAYEQMGVVPDVLTTAKGLGGGIPIGATLVAGDAAEALGRGSYGTTFGAIHRARRCVGVAR